VATDDTDARASVLAHVRKLVSGDGADFELLPEQPDAGRIDLRLVIPEGACQDCIMPRAFLEQVVTQMFREADQTVTAVSIVDPREAPAGSATVAM
jgi:Fe-S cluster biogenesis protein NfuA